MFSSLVVHVASIAWPIAEASLVSVPALYLTCIRVSFRHGAWTDLYRQLKWRRELLWSDIIDVQSPFLTST